VSLPPCQRFMARAQRIARSGGHAEAALQLDDLPPQLGDAIVDLLQHSTNFCAGSHLEREFVVLKMSSTNRGKMMTIGLTPHPPTVCGVPIHCAHCKQPFPWVNGRVEAWRSSTGGYFCNEFCAEDDEEATVQSCRAPVDRRLPYPSRGWGAPNQSGHFLK